MKIEKRSSPNQKLITETAIVISKKISAKKSDQEAIKTIMRLRYGMFDDDGKKIEKFFIEFMTKSGTISFLVPRGFYHKTKINAMGILEHDHKKIYKFIFKKIATSADVAKLDW